METESQHEFRSLDKEQLKQMLDTDEDFVLINVLPEEKFREQHIPGSVNIPVGDENFVQRVEEKAGSRDRKVVVYCANTECQASPKAAKQLGEAGFKEVYDYEAGMQDWKDAGFPVESS